MTLETLEEAASQVLASDSGPKWPLFIYGPPSTGKSTFLRVLQAVVGAENTAAVTLRDLAKDPFAAADLYGKSLNVVHDMSKPTPKEVEWFAKVTSDEPIAACRKYGKPFTFTNHAMMVFAANDIDVIIEPSGILLERMIPFKFPNSFLGKENPEVEKAVLAELSGILNRLIAAYRRRSARGYFLPPSSIVQADLARARE
jgi:putative DNA primase/helicase